MSPPRDLRGTWPRAIASLAGAILFILTIRWALFEPYVIPSESMVPTLLVHDHIFVNKFAYGFRLPFAQRYLFRTSFPERGDILVFRSVEDEGIFLIKRVVGLPGDKIEFRDGDLFVNDAAETPGHQLIRDRDNSAGDRDPITVSPDHLFMAGDNRDHSSDSRVWGTLAFDRVLGRASVIWLSCEEALAPSDQLCNPQTMRWNRLLKAVR